MTKPEPLLHSARQLVKWRDSARRAGLWDLVSEYDEELRRLGYED